MKITNPIEQSYDTIQEGVYNSEYYFLEKTFTVSQFIDICSEIDRQPPKNKSVKQLERIYWHEKSPIKPIYGSDQNMTEVDLGEFDLNKVKSILSDTIIEQYEGIVSAYLYFGTWRSTSPWHTEDMDLSAANLLLYGQPKLWYCIPPDFGNQFESLSAKLTLSEKKYEHFYKRHDNFIRHKRCLIHPDFLIAHNIPFNTIIQRPGDIVIVNPYCYHAVFNSGFNVSQAVNLATPNWQIRYDPENVLLKTASTYYHGSFCVKV